MNAVKIQFLMWPLVDIISVTTIAAVFIVGIRWLGTNGITVGIIIAFMSYIWRFWEPVSNLGT